MVIGFALVPATLFLSWTVKIATNNWDFDVNFTKVVLEKIVISSSRILLDGNKITLELIDLFVVEFTVR